MNEKRDDFIKAYVHVFGCKNGLFVIRKFFLPNWLVCQFYKKRAMYRLVMYTSDNNITFDEAQTCTQTEQWG